MRLREGTVINVIKGSDNLIRVVGLEVYLSVLQQQMQISKED